MISNINFNSHKQKNEIGPPLYTTHSSKGITDLNERPTTLKLLKENAGGKLLDMGPGGDFLQSGTQIENNKSKSKQGRLHQTKKLRKPSTNEKPTYLTGGKKNQFD